MCSMSISQTNKNKYYDWVCLFVVVVFFNKTGECPGVIKIWQQYYNVMYNFIKMHCHHFLEEKLKKI